MPVRLITDLSSASSPESAWEVEKEFADAGVGVNYFTKVEAAQGEWRAEMDQLGRFTGERCVEDPRHQVSASALYAGYSRWVEESGERDGMTATAFGRSSVTVGFAKKDTNRGSSTWESH